MVRFQVPFAAEARRGGVKCKADFVPNLLQHEDWLLWCGSYHLNVPLTFADGVQWLARFRWDLDMPSGNAGFALTSSDVATTMMAHLMAPRFVPRAILPPHADREFIGSFGDVVLMIFSTLFAVLLRPAN
jgi:hypothetical protein